MKVMFIGFIWGSKRDGNGNTYWAMEVIRTSDGKKIFGGVTGGESNCKSILWALCRGQDYTYLHHTSVVGVREFSRITKNEGFLREQEVMEFFND